MQGKMSNNKTATVEPLYVVKAKLMELYFISVLGDKKEFSYAQEKYLKALATSIELYTEHLRE